MILSAIDARPQAGAVTAFAAWLARELDMPHRVHALNPWNELFAELNRPQVRLLVLAAGEPQRGAAIELDHELVARSPRPVIALPTRATGPWLAPHAASRNLRAVVVCGADGSFASVRAAREAGEVAARLSGRVVLAHVLADPPPEAPLWSQPGSVDVLADARRSCRERLVGPAVGAASRAAAGARARYLAGDPVRALDRLAAEESAALIAVGSHGLGERPALRGSVSRGLIRVAGRPVLVVPAASVTERRIAASEATTPRPHAGVGAR